MPAIFDSLVKKQHLTNHVAWRVSFIVPFILINTIAVGLLLLTDDTPTGKWADRATAVQTAPTSHHTVVPTTGGLDDKPATTGSFSSDEKKRPNSPGADVESATGDVQVVDGYAHEVIQKPSFKEAMKVVFSLQTAMLCAGYFNSFGAELAVNSILGAYYTKNFPKLGQTKSGQWAAMFGLLNIVTRPLGGFLADVIYRRTGGNLWAKKSWVHVLGVIAGSILIVIGKLNSHHQNTMFGLIALFAIFLEAGNGANFAMVPHIHPHANGKSTPFSRSAGRLLMIHRYPLWNCRRDRKLWRYYLCDYLPVQQDELRKDNVDHWHDDDCDESHVCVGEAYSYGTDWRSLSTNFRYDGEARFVLFFEIPVSKINGYMHLFDTKFGFFIDMHQYLKRSISRAVTSVIVRWNVALVFAAHSMQAFLVRARRGC